MGLLVDNSYYVDFTGNWQKLIDKIGIFQITF